MPRGHQPSLSPVEAIGGGVISHDAGGTQYVAMAAGLNSAIWPVKSGPARVTSYPLPQQRWILQ